MKIKDNIKNKIELFRLKDLINKIELKDKK